MAGERERFRASGLVTLASDFGTRDGYVGAMKGVMLAIEPGLRLVDLAHELPPQDVAHAARALEAACPHFPRGTVHLAVVDPGVGGTRAPIALFVAGHAFVGPDNGLFSLAARALAGGCSACRIDPTGALARCLPPHPSATFHGRDLFAPTAALLASGRVSPAEVGPALVPVGLEIPPPRRLGEMLLGQVTHFDRFGNAVTNLHRSDLPAGTAHAEIGAGERARLVRTYGDAEPGECVVLLGSTDLLEIAVRDGSARERLGLTPGALVRIAPEASRRR